jgi:hypothetical protein
MSIEPPLKSAEKPAPGWTWTSPKIIILCAVTVALQPVYAYFRKWFINSFMP